MIKKFIMNLKIRRAEKKLNHLLDLRDLHYDYKDILDQITETKKELTELGDDQFIKKIQHKQKFENLDPSIFDRCRKCDTIFLKDEKHHCKI